MNSYLGLIQQSLFYGFFITLLFSLLCALLLPVIFPKLNKQFSPSTRATLLTSFCTLPSLATLFLLFLAILPSLLQVLGISSDHCLGHEDGHIHFCLIHRHEVINNWLIWTPALLYLLMLASVFIFMLTDFLETYRFQKKLNGYRKETSQQKDIVVLETDTPLALSCGILKPLVYLSTGLIKNLSKVEANLVIRHEKAHIARQDAFRFWVARSLSLFHMPSVRRQLLQQLTISCEQACDEAAIADSEPGQLATLLLKIERLYQGYFPTGTSLTMSVTGTDNHLEKRVLLLLKPLQTVPVTSNQILLVISLICLLLLPAHDVLHDAFEHLISLISAG